MTGFHKIFNYDKGPSQKSPVFKHRNYVFYTIFWKRHLFPFHLPMKHIIEATFLVNYTSSTYEESGFWNFEIKLLKGETGKQALKLICQHFFNFQLIHWNFQHKLLFLKSFKQHDQIWPNTTIQYTFRTAQHKYCTVFLTFLFFNVEKVGKTVQNARCAVQNVHCAVVLGQIWLCYSNGLRNRSLCRKFQYNWSKIEETLANKL